MVLYLYHITFYQEKSTDILCVTLQNKWITLSFLVGLISKPSAFNLMNIFTRDSIGSSDSKEGNDLLEDSTFFSLINRFSEKG